MKVAIIGSRMYENTRKIKDTLFNLKQRFGDTLIIISGGAKDGADRFARKYALEFGKYNIRVNGINADRIKSGLLTDQFIKERAKARNMSSTEYLNNNKIAMAITGTANATSVAEHVMTMMLCLTKNIFESDKLVKLGKFKEKGNLPNYFELYNKKILILGFIFRTFKNKA